MGEPVSYDIYIKIDTGAPELTTIEDVGNYTINCRPMFVEASGGMGPTDLDGLSCPDAREVLLRVVRAMEDNPPKYQALNPSNGWGSYLTWLEYLRKWLTACERHPKGVVAVSA